VNDSAIKKREPAKVEQLFKTNPEVQQQREEILKKIDLFSTKKRVAENDVCVYQDFINRNQDVPEEYIIENKKLLDSAIEQRKMYAELLHQAQIELYEIDSK